MYAGKVRARLDHLLGWEVLERLAHKFNAEEAIPGRRARPAEASLPLDISSETTTKPNVVMKSKPSPQSEGPVVRLEPASNIDRYPSNRTPKKEKVEAMSVSIKELGIIQPLIGRPHPEIEGRIQLVAGETRWLGACGVDADYPVPILVSDMTDKEAARVHATENFQRADLNEIEEAREIDHLKQVGWTFDEIVDHLGRGKDYLYRRVALLKLPEEGQLAVIEGNLDQRTAHMISTLPEELREKAVKAVVRPANSSRAMSREQALDHIRREFVEPLEKEKEWNEKRHLLEKENPGCVWLEYEEAGCCAGYHSEYEPADDRPGYSELSDAARTDEIPVPTWGELAKKHKAPIYIGRKWDDTPRLYVKSEPIVEAEKASCDDDPASCVFAHENAVQQVREATEKRKLEQEAARAAIDAERHRFATAVMTVSIGKTAVRKLVESICFCLQEWGMMEDLSKLLEIPEANAEGVELGYDERHELLAASIRKMMRAKGSDAFEVLGRLVAGEFIEANYQARELADLGFQTGALKPDVYPQFHKTYLENEADRAREAREKEEAANAAKADGEEAA